MDATASPTVTELAVRKYLDKADLKSILEKTGRSASGPKEELAERVLADSTLDLEDVFGKLSEEDLRKLLKELDLPIPPQKSFFQRDPKDILLGERGRLSAHLVELGKKQGWAPRSTVVETASPNTPARPPSSPVPSPVVLAPPLSRPQEQPTPAAHSGPSPSLVGGSDTAQFEELCRFLDGYTFTKRWDEEIQYEAELGGAISGHFRGQKVVHQMAVGGTRADLVACGAVIEIKYPKTRQPLQTLTGQVEGYQKLFGNRVIVVICTGGMRDTQAFNDSAASLTERGAKVYIK
jgi:hypothetical protein